MLVALVLDLGRDVLGGLLQLVEEGHPQVVVRGGRQNHIVDHRRAVGLRVSPGELEVRTVSLRHECQDDGRDDLVIVIVMVVVVVFHI